MKKEQEIPPQVLELAKQRGFDAVKKEKSLFKGYKVYFPYYSGKRVFCGLPQFIIQNDNETRFATEKETHFIVFNC